jgi:hypothetical protein
MLWLVSDCFWRRMRRLRTAHPHEIRSAVGNIVKDMFEGEHIARIAGHDETMRGPLTAARAFDSEVAVAASGLRRLSGRSLCEDFAELHDWQSLFNAGKPTTHVQR